MKHLWVKIIWGIAAGCIHSAGMAQQSFRVMEYNVENFFDCRHDTLKKDDGFLPGSLRRWTGNRYRDKVAKIAKVVLAAGGFQVPDVVGLCEVENAYCMESLVKYSPLRDASYRYVMTDSPDERGIDVALLYQSFTFRPVSVQSLRIPPRQGCKPTRDILHVAGKVVSGDTLDVFVCHFPSRAGGERRSAPYRLFVAERLRHAADSVMGCRRRPHLVIMGDFNDAPSSRPLREGLRAEKPGGDIRAAGLYNLMDGQGKDTYRYHGEWEAFDQIIVNGRLLLESSAVRAASAGPVVLDFPFLLEEDDRYGGEKPFRTYQGMKYHGGYSDHLPVLLELEIK